MALPQHGGEGTASYKGKKSDSKLPQHGGEGSGLSKKSDTGLLNPTRLGEAYCGPGRHLRTMSN